MKLLLIQPSDSFVDRGYESPPLGLAYLGSIAEQKGWEVKIIVASTLNVKLSDEQILREAVRFSPDAVGISILTFSATISYELFKRLSYLDSILIAGGPHATILPEEVLTYSPCNILVRGEAEGTFSELLDLIERKEANLTDIKGISFKDEQGRIFHNPPRALLSEESLNKVPFPAKHLFSKKHYRFGNIVASRGCPFSCTYCSQSVFKKIYRIRKVENVFEEVKWLYKRCNVQHFFFVDDVFTFNELWAKSLCEKIIMNKLSITWHCFARVDCVTENLLTEMKKAGCIYIIYGIESINPRSLEKIKKKITIEDIKRILIWTKNAGIGIALSFIWGFPWDTLEDIKRQIEFIKEVSPIVYFIDINGIVPFPGTEIYDEYGKRYNLKEWWLKDRSARKQLHLYQQLLSCDPAIEKPFFQLSQEVMGEIKKAYAFMGEKLIFSTSMMIKTKERYTIIDQETLSKSLSFKIVRLVKLFLIMSSKVMSSFSPDLELRFLTPTYKITKSLWLRFRAILANATAL